MQVNTIPNVQEDIETLSNHEAFLRFMTLVFQMREECIEEMHLASSENIQQISGRLLSYDQILHMVNYDSLLARHRN